MLSTNRGNDHSRLHFLHFFFETPGGEGGGPDHGLHLEPRDDHHGPGLMAYIPNEAAQVEIASKIGFNKIFTGEASV